MSHHDSSSLEYLDNNRFYEEDYEDHFYSPVFCLPYRKFKPDHVRSGKHLILLIYLLQTLKY